jgi:predicted tellurium resistance membrane protein TerC
MTEIIIALVTLSFLEIVLGIDNVIFISILSGKLPPAQQKRARRVGLIMAMVMRIGLLMSLAWLANLTMPLFTLAQREVSARDLVLIGGGLFLLAKSTFEIHEGLEGADAGPGSRTAVSFGSVIAQVMVLDIVFSLDSVITAIGMANQLPVMVAAIIFAVLVMMFAAEPISAFVSAHPTVKMLALSFLLLIGISLVAEGVGPCPSRRSHGSPRRPVHVCPRAYFRYGPSRVHRLRDDAGRRGEGRCGLRRRAA